MGPRSKIARSEIKIKIEYGFITAIDRLNVSNEEVDEGRAGGMHECSSVGTGLTVSLNHDHACVGALSREGPVDD